MDLQELWFCLIAFFFGAYFVLEGFDLGVGLLLPFLPRNAEDRGVMFRSIRASSAARAPCARCSRSTPPSAWSRRFSSSLRQS